MAPPSEWPWNRQKPTKSDPRWPVGVSRMVSRWIKVAFYRIFLTWTRWLSWRRFFREMASPSGLEIGENPPDPILNGLLVPPRWSPSGLKLLFTVFSWWWFVKDFEAQIEAAPPSIVWAPVAGPDTVIEGGKTPKASSEVKAGQEEKSSSGHQFQSTSSTGFSSSSSLSPSPEGSSSERKKKMMIHGPAMGPNEWLSGLWGLWRTARSWQMARIWWGSK